MEKTPKKHFDQLATDMQAQYFDRAAAEKFFKEILPFVRYACEQTIARYASKQRVLETQDLAQIACGKIWVSLPKFDRALGHFSTWVWTIVRRSWFDVLDAQEEKFVTECESEISDQQPDDMSPLEDQVDARMAFFKIERALSPPAFECLVANASGCSAHDVAEFHGMNVDTVKSRIRVAKNRAAAALMLDITLAA